MMGRPGPKSQITPEVGAEILKAYLAQTPRPSQRELARRFNMDRSTIQRYLKQNEPVLSNANQTTATAELVVAAIPGAVAEVRALTRDLPITSLCKVMEEAEKQYARFKDDDPHLAGGYLDQMRKCAIEMAKWLGIDKGLGVQDTSVKFEVEWRKGT
jgi:transcriptional regulator with XRE-family HTH domain